MKTFAVTQL